jgi:hypothetical protein
MVRTSRDQGGRHCRHPQRHDAGPPQAPTAARNTPPRMPSNPPGSASRSSRPRQTNHPAHAPVVRHQSTAPRGPSRRAFDPPFRATAGGGRPDPRQGLLVCRLPIGQRLCGGAAPRRLARSGRVATPAPRRVVSPPGRTRRAVPPAPGRRHGRRSSPPPSAPAAPASGAAGGRRRARRRRGTRTPPGPCSTPSRTSLRATGLADSAADVTTSVETCPRTTSSTVPTDGSSTRMRSWSFETRPMAQPVGTLTAASFTKRHRWLRSR